MSYKGFLNTDHDPIERIRQFEKSQEYLCYRNILANIRREIVSGKHDSEKLQQLHAKEHYLTQGFAFENPLCNMEFILN